MRSDGRTSHTPAHGACAQVLRLRPVWQRWPVLWLLYCAAGLGYAAPLHSDSVDGTALVSETQGEEAWCCKA